MIDMAGRIFVAGQHSKGQLGLGDVDDEMKQKIYDDIKASYELQADPRYAAARMWIDEIIDPADTRKILIRSLEIISHQTKIPAPNFGVLQV